MIRRVEALRYRCLHHVSQALDPFHVLVGPNASGKTTFLDTIAFLGRIVSDGLDAALDERSANFRDLLWQRTEATLELALEARIPESLQAQLPETGTDRVFDTVRYEISLGIEPTSEAVAFLAERVTLRSEVTEAASLLPLFPADRTPPRTLLSTGRQRGIRTVVNKNPGGNDSFHAESSQEVGKGWAPIFRLGPRKSALGNLPDDATRFPVTTWLRQLLATGVQPFVLNGLFLRRAAPPNQGRGFRTDGSNLPWVVHELFERDPARGEDWIAHVRTALPDIESIRSALREDDKHRYLMIRYRGGMEIPSWMVSDGTLRLLALTLPAYLPSFHGIYLIEEPENGIHPRAVETVLQSLQSAYEAQVLIASHSPVVLSMVEPAQVLCFAKTPLGSSDIVRGDRHPALRDWKRDTNLGVLYASGVLG